MRTAADLERVLAEIARRFAQGVLEAATAATFEELEEARRDLPQASAKRAAPRPAPGKRRGRPSTVLRHAQAIAGAVRAAGVAGIQAAGLMTALGFTRAIFNAAIRRAVLTKLVRREGAKRGTRYFAT